MGLLSLGISLAMAVSAGADARLGNVTASFPIRRLGGGSSVVTVGVGTPAQMMNLTLSTSVDYVMVATCPNCVDLAPLLQPQPFQPSQTELNYAFSYPTSGDRDGSLHAFGQVAVDSISILGHALSPILVLGSLSDSAGRGIRMSAGTSGFLGLGLDELAPQRSVMPYVARKGSLESFTIGLDMKLFSSRPGTESGTMHWGGVPADAYVGSFKWVSILPNSSWAVAIEGIEVGGRTVTLGSRSFVTLDPALDPIYVPPAVAADIFALIPGAQRDSTYIARWNVPCNTAVNMFVTVAGVRYTLDPAGLVSAKDKAGRTCWANIVSWANDSVPAQAGEIRLGNSFLSGVYAALYYSEKERLIGLAGKPDSINESMHRTNKPNGLVIGVVLGVGLPLLFIFMIVCYFRNRTTIWSQRARAQERATRQALAYNQQAAAKAIKGSPMMTAATSPESAATSTGLMPSSEPPTTELYTEGAMNGTAYPADRYQPPVPVYGSYARHAPPGMPYSTYASQTHSVPMAPPFGPAPPFPHAPYHMSQYGVAQPPYPQPVVATYPSYGPGYGQPMPPPLSNWR